MNFLRANLPGMVPSHRGNGSRPGAEPPQQAADLEGQSGSSRPGTSGGDLPLPRTTTRPQPAFVGSFFHGRRVAIERTAPGQVEAGDDPQSPKTPRFTLETSNPSSTRRLHVPFPNRPQTASEMSSVDSRPATPAQGPVRADAGAPTPPVPALLFSRPTEIERPTMEILDTPRPVGRARVRALLMMMGRGQSAPRAAASSRADAWADPGSAGSRRRPHPKRFLCIFPWIRSRRTRAYVVRCFVSGLFLLLLITIYLALSATKNINAGEFTILLILVILFATIFFCHSLIRLCMSTAKSSRGSGTGGSQMMGVGGPYAVPREPIRVVLAEDEAIREEVEVQERQLKPPAYGLWRESVRVDPDLLFWQRNPDRPPTRSTGPYTMQSGPRPPSYASDDGVSYVVEAMPRSTAPTSEVFHSVEASRYHQRQAAACGPTNQHGHAAA